MLGQGGGDNRLMMVALENLKPRLRTRDFRGHNLEAPPKRSPKVNDEAKMQGDIDRTKTNKST